MIEVTDTEAAKEDEKGKESAERATEGKKSAKGEDEDIDRMESSF